jgi:hypothetical protein
VSRSLTSLHRKGSLSASLTYAIPRHFSKVQPIATLPSIRASGLHLVAAFTQPSVTSAVIFQWRQKLLCQPQLPLHRASDSGCDLCLPWGELKLFGAPHRGTGPLDIFEDRDIPGELFRTFGDLEEASPLSNHGSKLRSNPIAPLRPVKKTTLRSSPGCSSGCFSKLIGIS